MFYEGFFMSGFVYIWYDRKHKRYYIGSHWGSQDDGYICSSTWMLNSYTRRCGDFTRRILAVKETREEMYREEYRWLSMIKDHEYRQGAKSRYYNLHKHAGHWSIIDDTRKTVGERISAKLKGRKNGPPSEETRQKIAAAQLGQKRPHASWTEERREDMSKRMKGRKREDLGEEWKKNHAEAMSRRRGRPGTPWTDEQRQKNSAAQRGLPKDPGAVAKMREKINEGWANGRVHPMQGKQHTEEARQKISEAQRGRANRPGTPHTDESKQKMRDGIARSRAEGRGRWAGYVRPERPPKEPRPRKKIVRSPEAVARRKETMARKYAEGYVSPRKGAVFSEEHRRRLSEAKRARA